MAILPASSSVSLALAASQSPRAVCHGRRLRLSNHQWQAARGEVGAPISEALALQHSRLESKLGSLEMLLAMRRASSSVSTLAMCASSGFSRE
jgi:hypothetical protein